MSFLKLGWNWIRLAITHQWKIRFIGFYPVFLTLILPVLL
jgi:hypothetical protein